MSNEPGLVDANVLVYAMDADAPQYESSRALLESARDGTTTLYVTSQILCEFYSIVTNVRRVPNPRSPKDALAAISGLLEYLRVLPLPVRTVELWLDQLRRRPVIGARIFDLQIAAAMQANGIQQIYTFNTSDFEGISGLKVLAPGR
jgi:predicted nucleic acid-binding protein